jgi:hypothetical protein
MRLLVLTFLTLLIFPATILAAENSVYPYTNPYQATVYGTPPEMVYAIKAPVKPALKSIRIKDRDVPEVFSYSDEMFYSTALQKGKAPLIFIIAGTGAEHDSTKMKFLTQVFYQAGFHVVALSSPTHMNFIVSVSEYAAPGYVPHDVNDLYRVMLWIKTEIEKKKKISGYYITGYSLGAMHAAFLTHKDSELGDFNFRKTLMINPPVSLYHSVNRLDSWLTPENLGDKTPHDEIEHFVDLFSDYYERADVTDLDDNFLYELVTHIDLEDKDLRALIAVDFRMSSSSMIFSSDVCLRAGYVVPPDEYPLAAGTPLMPYAEAAFEISFEGYLNEFLLPYLKSLNPGMDRYTLLQKSSLYDIRTYLKKTEKIVLIGNRDDVILNDHDLSFIDGVFGDRATFFPTGGHCGNLMSTPFVEAMLEKVKP